MLCRLPLRRGAVLVRVVVVGVVVAAHAIVVGAPVLCSLGRVAAFQWNGRKKHIIHIQTQRTRERRKDDNKYIASMWDSCMFVVCMNFNNFYKLLFK